LINEKHAKVVACIAIVCALLFTVAILFIPKNVLDGTTSSNSITATYSDTLMKMRFHIQISLDDESWAAILRAL
jgi:hypothetical protein